jgi:hypothetical protein
MSNTIARVSAAAFLFLAIVLAATGNVADRVSAADAQVAGLAASTPLSAAPEAATPRMTPLPRMAQARCPGGQLVFLSRACGCNGACCLCSRQTPYLNHCTCRCEAVPSPCARGHSAGNP